jgi:Icc-related predicted phosphoesterase
MKIAVCSDLHLEFGDLVLKNDENADVLILSGDICVAKELPFADSHQGERFRDFFARCSLEFPNVLMIAGNHESYHGDITKTTQLLKDAVSDLTNFHVLEKESFVLNDVTFVGGTLWTDMNQEDPHTLSHVGNRMNDFQIVKNSASTISYKTHLPNPDDPNVPITQFKTRPATFTTSDAVQEHKAMLEYIMSVVDSNTDSKFVVVGHHAPSKLSTKPQYEKDVIMNGGYSSDLSQFILDRPQIKMWTHGHTHHCFDYVIGETRIVCNPRGYINYEAQADDFELQYFEV